MSVLHFMSRSSAVSRGRLRCMTLVLCSVWANWATAADAASPGALALMSQARSSGTADQLTLTAQLTPATLHAGLAFEAYVVAVVPNLGNAVFARNAVGKWVAMSDANAVPAALSGTAGAEPLTVTLAHQDNTIGLSGTRIYLGYGLNSDGNAFAEMLTQRRYEQVHTLGKGLAPWALEP